MTPSTITFGPYRLDPKGPKLWKGDDSVQSRTDVAPPVIHLDPDRLEAHYDDGVLTLTVPVTLTRAPSGGSARQNGTWSAARWTTLVMS